jgi:hypothetical protein
MEYRLEIERTGTRVHGYYSVWKKQDSHTWEKVHASHYRSCMEALKVLMFRHELEK